jgi:oxygen-independent coproporphyrinogen-3 oxidase
MRQQVSAYIHIPFCLQRCGYCDFNTYAGEENRIPAYLSALEKEISTLADSVQDDIEIHTIYFGGGTPSLLEADQLETVSKAINACFIVTPEVEISIEANPGTLTGEKLSELRRIGFNRISIGAQSANSVELKLLNRIHDWNDVVDAVEMSRKAGWDNINLDMIFGLPNQSLAGWKSNIETALKLELDHLSIYNLTIEEGTPLFAQYQSGELGTLSDDVAADLYQFTMDFLKREGYQQYEISNWTRDGVNRDYRCKHNLQYWRNQPYFGFGAGAHGFFNGIRTVNAPWIGDYTDRMMRVVLNSRGQLAQITKQVISLDEQMNDTMMLGLRLTEEGVHQYRFNENYKIDMFQRYAAILSDLKLKGLIEIVDEESVRLTERGRLLGNQVFMEFA